MSIIYVPKGKAREYSPLSCNLYTGCNHRCVYCYAPGIRRMTREQYEEVTQRRNVLREFERDCRKYTYSKHPVLFCFMTDPYNALEKELRITRDALKLCYKYKIPVQILTKSVSIIDDIDILKKFGSHINAGMTITTSNNQTSEAWEPGASMPQERIETMRILKQNGIRTWASFEPVFVPEQSLEMIKKVLPYVDIYKIGKINNYKGIDKNIDWNKFLKSAVQILRDNKKSFYVKRDLRVAAGNVKLYDNEMSMDGFLPERFERNDLFS